MLEQIPGTKQVTSTDRRMIPRSTPYTTAFADTGFPVYALIQSACIVKIRKALH
jgi:hypothetical protein